MASSCLQLIQCGNGSGFECAHPAGLSKTAVSACHEKDANAKLDKTTGTIGVFYNFKQFLKMKYYVARFDTS